MTYQSDSLVSPEAIRAGSRALPGIKSVEEVRQAANLAGVGSNLVDEKPDLARRKSNLVDEKSHLVGASQAGFARLKTPVSPLKNGRAASNLAGVRGEHVGVNGSAA